MAYEVTISIINYNYGRYLKGAIDSALEQTTEIAFQVLVIDDGSTDCSDEVAAAYKDVKNFKYSKTENRGFAAALTRAVSEAEGKYLFLMDADDYFKPNKIECVLPYLKAGDLYVADTSYFNVDDGREFRPGRAGSTSCVAVNREAAVHLLPVENELSFAFFREAGRGRFLPEHYTFYRIHGSSMTDRKKPGKWQNYLGRITLNLSDQLFEISKKEPLPAVWNISKATIVKVARRIRAQHNYNKLEEALETNQRVEAFKRCARLFYWKLAADKSLNLFHFKMLAKTFLNRPSDAYR